MTQVCDEAAELVANKKETVVEMSLEKPCEMVMENFAVWLQHLFERRQDSRVPTGD